MGIPGLTSFINRNSIQYFENRQLKDTLVIIDGYALTNFLYGLYENKTSAFGGDYDILANVYIDFINLFIRCNVTPIFVFDGAYEQRKIETIMQRMSDRIKTYSQPIKTSNCMPCFGSDILFDILNDMDIPHVNCDFEADAEIVSLAKLLDCPILSRDSDFYLNTVPYIPLDKIILDLKSSENVINCQVYKVEKLLEEFGGLNIDYLPLLAALLGNDYIRPDTFSSLLRLRPGTFNCGLKLQRIVKWLRNQKNVNMAIYYMTHNLNNKVYVTQQIENIIKDYKNVNSKYISFILQFGRMGNYRDHLKSYIKINENNILPNWLVNNYRKGIVNSEVMTILTLKKTIFKVCVEDTNRRPYFEVSFKILASIYGLLFGNTDFISGIGRKNGLNTGIFKIKPLLNNPYIPLADINKADLEYRKKIILNLICLENVEKFKGFPKEWELFIIILMYWAMHTNNYKTNHMHALIINSVLFNVIKKPKTIEDPEVLYSTKKSILEQNIYAVKKEDCLKAMNNLSEYLQINQYKSIGWYQKIIHPFAQFQSCVYYFSILNSLLDFPFEQCRIENFFKGSFLYNLCEKMEDYEPELFIFMQLFNKFDSLGQVYVAIIKHIDEIQYKKKKISASSSKNSELQGRRL